MERKSYFCTNTFPSPAKKRQRNMKIEKENKSILIRHMVSRVL